MLLLHQVGSVKIGEVVRYTVTYTPSRDRILPSPEVLHLRIRNTSPLPLRAAFVHGPYTLSVSAYPAHYDPNTKFDNPRRYGVPEFEPMLKAAGAWSCQLTVPDNIRQSAGMGAARGDFMDSAIEGGENVGASWVIEVASQVIFSSSASVGFEILLARDEKSLSLGGIPVAKGHPHVQLPGKVGDFQQGSSAKDIYPPRQLRGVFSKAIDLKVEDTASLWNTPKLPGWNHYSHATTSTPGHGNGRHHEVVGFSSPSGEGEPKRVPRPKKIHLVVLTHGLHSNLGADMLFLKESIDATTRQAKIDAKNRKARQRAGSDANQNDDGTERRSEGEDEDNTSDEEVIVRGFSGNATRTERGIKFLGKRLARYILSMTYPDQPFLPVTKKAGNNISTTIKNENAKGDHRGRSAHGHNAADEDERSFQITSISLIGHSLGGLIQTYAVAYIQKHSPQFFDLIQPVNFIALASPFLGLSNENPLYVKFALDFGLVGRTGQDLGLTWRAPTIARSGWGAIVGTLGESAHKKVMGESQPESKPLLRILPTGPAHAALKKFRNRTVYSNVVNDGIVPLRTSCLLFLDWQGLDRVEKARREAGLVETVVGFGWAELTGTSMSRKGPWNPEAEEASSPSTPGSVSGNPQSNSHEVPQPPSDATVDDNSHEVPQPSSNATVDDDRRSLNLATTPRHHEIVSSEGAHTSNDSPFSGFFNFFKGNSHSRTPNPNPSPPRSLGENKIYKRSQTLNFDDTGSNSASSGRTKISSGQEFENNESNKMSTPPRTTFFESAGDLLNPKLPSVEFLLDPSKRPRTIFHDRVYYPSDIPPPPLKKRPTGTLIIRRRSASHSGNLSPKSGSSAESSFLEGKKTGVQHQDSIMSARDYDDPSHTDPGRQPDEVIDSSNMRVEEKIARAYHRDLSWRKVLVNLDPDAHNNIIVRRTFANAFGWPVVKHLVDAHFSDNATVRTRDEVENNMERAKPMDKGLDKTGTETKPTDDRGNVSACNGAGNQLPNANNKEDNREDRATRPITHERSASEAREAADAVPDLPTSEEAKAQTSHSFRETPPRPPSEAVDTAAWSDRDFADSGDESEFDTEAVYGQHCNHGLLPPEGEASGGGEDKTRRSVSPVWNWTEKIVGKSSSRKTKESGGQSPSELRSGSGDSGAVANA
ncbi:putative revertant of glycogen synthase kinase mutation protein [Rosellinia necatrix]|uniref:Putative revertant of glycogen synthase kinase mutation protein n=1 Tax=Rosellinia necatrix TaxID=77044 RepID=A0A1W2TVX8_ROSNE|nr:putative revertant of glycogen synthase kinase mutation protein [Rosellinia necatrix]